MPEEGGKTARDDFAVGSPRGFEIGEADVDGFAPHGSMQKQTPREELADGGGDGGTCDAEVEGEDENGVEKDVEYGSADDANHAETGVSLQAKLVVEGEG